MQLILCVGNQGEQPVESGIPDAVTYQPESTKCRVVVLGSGWGAVSFIKGLSKSQWSVYSTINSHFIQ